MALKPTNTPRWCHNGVVPNASNIVEPSSGEKDAGWQNGNAAPAPKMNWILENIFEWCRYLSDGAIAGPFSFASAINAGNISGTLHDWAPTGAADAIVVRAATTGTDATITGIPGGVEGRVLIIESTGSDDSVIEFLHENAGSVAANRIIVPGAVQATLADRCSIVLCYDGTASRWRVVGGRYTVPQTIYVDGSAGQVATGSSMAWTVNVSDRNYWASSSSSQVLTVPLPVRVGDRIRSARFHLKDASGGTVQARIIHSSGTGGTQAGDTMVSAGTGAVQAVSLTGLSGSAAKVGTSSPFWRAYFLTNTNSAVEIYAVELTVDRYLP